MKIAIESLKQSPFFKPLWPALQRFQHHETLPTLSELNQKLCIDGIRFVPQCVHANDFSSGYEPRIFEKGEVQTRELSWHDFFNALVWHQFPKTKKVINALHYQLQRKRFPDKQRLSAENMLTLFDENGAIVMSHNPDLLELIRQQRWHELFWQRREDLKQQLQVILFGHGLIEKCLQPYIGITAKALLFHQTESDFMDTITANFFSNNSADLEPSQLCPLPILGIPDWWAENQNESFYSNKAYFRDK